jgi:hypothetical protein
MPERDKAATGGLNPSLADWARQNATFHKTKACLGTIPGRTASQPKLLEARVGLPEMRSRGKARGGGVSPRDGGHDRLVFAVEPAHVQLALPVAHLVEAKAPLGDDRAADHVEDPAEIRIMRREQDGAVKSEILLGP